MFTKYHVNYFILYIIYIYLFIFCTFFAERTVKIDRKAFGWREDWDQQRTFILDSNPGQPEAQLSHMSVH